MATPETMATGAAIWARCAAFCTAEGRRCRPLAFCFMLDRAPRLTGLPYFRICALLLGNLRLSLGLASVFIEQHDRTCNPNEVKMLQMAQSD
jgi:hypothetical protein